MRRIPRRARLHTLPEPGERRRAASSDPPPPGASARACRTPAARILRRGLRRLMRGGVSPDEFHEAVRTLRVELVLTAHPTEVSRRTLIHKYNRIAARLAERDRPDLTRPERDDLDAALRRELASAWETDEVRHAAAHTARRGAQRTDCLRAEPLARAAARRPQRRRRASCLDRPRAAARRGAGALRVVDWRRPGRQPARDRRGDARGLPALALGGCRSVPQRDRGAARRAIDDQRLRRPA